MEIIELDVSKHRFFFGCQFHPEYTSNPHITSPPFRGLIQTAGGLLDLTKVELDSTFIPATSPDGKA